MKNTPISLTSVATDIADIKAKAIKYATDYNVSIVVTKPEDGSTGYNYLYFVKFKYCNMYTISGTLTDSAGANITENVIPKVYLCDGRMYDSATGLPFVIKGYTKLTGGDDLMFEFSTFVAADATSLYVHVKNITPASGTTLTAATFNKMTNALTESTKSSGVNAVYPIVIENCKYGSPCFVNVFNDGGTIRTDVLPEADADLTLFEIPCVYV